MKFEIGSQVVFQYRRLSYKSWYALAEFVDNSTQSYFGNKAALDKALKKANEPLAVRINYDSKSKQLLISDNAMGMSEEDLAAALRVGHPPQDTSGRSEFGMGLKTAASWFGNEWTITTSKLGEPYELEVTVEVEKIGSGDLDLKVKKTKRDESLHYTTLAINQMHNKINGHAIRNIKECLGSIYREDLRQGRLELLFNDSHIESPINFSDDVFLKRSDGSLVRAEVSTTIGGKLVRGWIGVLNPNFTSRRNAGFAIIRRGRCIQGWVDAWEPDKIFGAAGGGLINQRVAGELFLDEFGVSHTKDAVLWENEDEEDLINYLVDLCAMHQILKIARDHRGKTDTVTDDVVSKTAKGIEEKLNADEMVARIAIDEVPPPEVFRDKQQDAQERETQSDSGEEPEIRIDLKNGTLIHVYLYDGHALEPYYMAWPTEESNLNSSTLKIYINKNHPSFKSLPDSVALEVWMLHCAFDAVAEWKCEQRSVPIEPNTVRELKDVYFRTYAAVIDGEV